MSPPSDPCGWVGSGQHDGFEGSCLHGLPGPHVDDNNNCIVPNRSDVVAQNTSRATDDETADGLVPQETKYVIDEQLFRMIRTSWAALALGKNLDNMGKGMRLVEAGTGKEEAPGEGQQSNIDLEEEVGEVTEGKEEQESKAIDIPSLGTSPQGKGSSQGMSRKRCHPVLCAYSLQRGLDNFSRICKPKQPR